MLDIDIVIPTVTGREDTLARCVESYERHTVRGIYNLIVITDEETCGKAWLRGMEKAQCDHIHLTCDDLEVTSPTWAGACMEAVANGKMPAPIVRRPDGSLESCGGDMNAMHCLISKLQPNGAEVDFSPVPFGSREQVEAIGMHPGHYETDTYFSHKGRELGWPTVVTYGYEFMHHHSNVKRRSPTPDDHRLYVEAME